MKNSALFSGGGVSRGPIGVAAPVPKVPILPASLPSKVVYAATPSPSVSSGPTPATPVSGPGTPAAGMTDDLVRRVAEAKRRVADAQSKLAIKDNPYMVRYFSILGVPLQKKKKRPSDLGNSVADHASNWQEEGYACRTDSTRCWLEDGSPSSSP